MACPPFSAARVSRFLALWLGAILLFCGLYFLLTHAAARESVRPQTSTGQPTVPASPSGVYV